MANGCVRQIYGSAFKLDSNSIVLAWSAVMEDFMVSDYVNCGAYVNCNGDANYGQRMDFFVDFDDVVLINGQKDLDGEDQVVP